MSLCALGVEGGPTQGGRQRLGRGTVQVGYRGVLGLLLRRYRQEGDASLPASRDYVRIQKYRTYNSRATASAGEGLVLCYVAWVLAFVLEFALYVVLVQHSHARSIQAVRVRAKLRLWVREDTKPT
jgi:hypothetical protein